jgi:hypothetical protein
LDFIMANTPPHAPPSSPNTATGMESRALHDHLYTQAGGSDAYALAAELIPKRGVAKLQSAVVRKLACEAFRGSRTRQRDF